MWLLKDTDCIENIVEKSEIAHFEQFHLFPQCVSKGLFLQCVKMIIYMEESVNEKLRERRISCDIKKKIFFSFFLQELLNREYVYSIAVYQNV